MQAGSLHKDTSMVHAAHLKSVSRWQIKNNSFQMIEKIKIDNTFTTISVDGSLSVLAKNRLFCNEELLGTGTRSE